MNDHQVVMMGLGYIGLPTAALIAKNGTRVIGVDINEEVVKVINSGKVHIIEPQLENEVSTAVKSGLLTAHTAPVEGDVYLIVVPTPFKGKHEPDISYVEAATRTILPLLKEGDLYIIESTSPIGTTEKMRDLIYESRPELENTLFIAYCPERVLPGNVMHELVHNDRVIGGIDDQS
ncbi:MAG: UDP-N-acetyl-D-mannosamine dehydrogenase, partial [Flavobacteriaceae bacterium]|nr:UDP-N-acetyl-D-mannosamine dehydrogenase [Flavobacteriaceae bacterium]